MILLPKKEKHSYLFPQSCLERTTAAQASSLSLPRELTTRTNGTGAPKTFRWNIYLSTLSLKERQEGWDFSLGRVRWQARLGRRALKRGKRGLVLLYLCDNTALLTFQVLAPWTRAGQWVPKFVPLESNRDEHSLLQWLLSALEKPAFSHFLRALLLHPWHKSEHVCTISVLAWLWNPLHLLQ